MSAIDEILLSRFLPLVFDVNRLCARPEGEELVRALTHLATLAPGEFDELAPDVLTRVQRALDDVTSGRVIPFPTGPSRS